MNERNLLIMAAVGASIVAYAVYALLSRGVVEQPHAPTPVSAPAEERSTPAPRPAQARPTAPREEAKPPGGPPPPLPKPKVSLEEAREDYDAFIEELERELKRNEETGKPLANEHWVEYYRRGHEIMDPLRMHMTSGTEAERKEVGELDEQLRTLMSKLQRDPSEAE